MVAEIDLSFIRTPKDFVSFVKQAQGINLSLPTACRILQEAG
jgi:hypothetical protein